MKRVSQLSILYHIMLVFMLISIIVMDHTMRYNHLQVNLEMKLWKVFAALPK